MPLAEVGDIIHSLTDKVLDIALAQQKTWREQGLDFDISVNLSARNLIDDRCIESLDALLKKHQTKPGRVELEITETALMQDPEGAKELLNRMAAMGVKLSIDDFGTGYSSLAYLRNLPISYLKIDRVFVRDMVANEQDTIIVQSTIALAHNLGLKVIAEGVEDQDAMHQLKTMNCDMIQGYHISRPQASEPISEWIANYQKSL